MRAATAPSACPGIRRDGSLEDGENRLELAAQVFHRLRGERAPCFGLQLARAAILLDFLARAFDRVFLGVQQVLHQHDQLDLASLVHTIAGAVFRGVQEPELALPVAKKDRKSTRLNSSHEWSSYAVFCLKKKKRLKDRINEV